MAPTSNWLSFSLSPMEMLRSSSSNNDDSPDSSSPHYITYQEAAAAAAAASSSSSASPSAHYFLDNFYSHGWGNSKDCCQEAVTTTMAETVLLTSFMDQQQSGGGRSHNHPPPAPKLEDFLGESAPDSSSLTQIQIYEDNAAAYFSEQQDLKAITAFHGGFPTNSGGSEVDDDSSTMGRTEFMAAAAAGQAIESELGYSRSNGLSLGVNNTVTDVSAAAPNHNNNTSSSSNTEKAMVVSSVESDCGKKLAETFGQRTSIYRGVTRHRWTGRYEAHLWDNSCRREGQARKGRQVYLGGYDKEDKAARAYDLAALKYWGPTATTNFPVTNYNKELEEMKYLSKQEFIASLRRKSSGFSRGASIYRGVTRHHQQGRWQARIGRVAGNKDLYLGTFATEEEAAEAYDIAAIKFRGMNAVTNFEMNRYDVEAIMKSALPIGGAAKRLKISLDSEQKPAPSHHDQQLECRSNDNSSINFGCVQQAIIPAAVPCGTPFDTTTAVYHHHHHNLLHHLPAAGGNLDASASMSNVGPSMMPQTTDFFLWPHHQSY